MKHMVRISDDQLKQLIEAYPEWKEMNNQDILTLALSKLLGASKKK